MLDQYQRARWLDIVTVATVAWPREAQLDLACYLDNGDDYARLLAGALRDERKPAAYRDRPRARS